LCTEQMWSMLRHLRIFFYPVHHDVCCVSYSRMMSEQEMFRSPSSSLRLFRKNKISPSLPSHPIPIKPACVCTATTTLYPCPPCSKLAEGGTVLTEEACTNNVFEEMVGVNRLPYRYRGRAVKPQIRVFPQGSCVRGPGTPHFALEIKAKA
jgi:hypothetical protein